MNERIKELRKSLGISQEEFGKKLGVGKSAISYIESGRSNVTEQMIKLMCKEYNVDYGWLTTGSGEMFIDFDSDVMARIDYIMCGEDSIAKRTFQAFAMLDESEWKVIDKLIDNIISQKK